MNEQNWDNSSVDPNGSDSGGSSGGSPLAGDVLRILRRRWWVIALLAAVTVPVGVYAGWKTGTKEFVSMGMVRVKPILTTVLYKSEDKGVLPMYDGFVNTQMTLLKGSRVVNAAVQDPRWTRAFGTATDVAVAEFTNSIEVSRSGEIVFVGVRHTSPATAQAGTQSLVAAYKRINVDNEGREDEQVLKTLQERQGTLANELRANRVAITNIAAEFGTEDLRSYQESKLKLVAELENELQRLKAALPASRPSVQERVNGEEVAAPTSTKSPSEMTAREAAAFDQRLANLVDRREELISQDAGMSINMGEQNPARVRLKNEIEQLDRRISERLEDVIKSGVIEKAMPQLLQAKDPAERAELVQKALIEARTDLQALGVKAQALKERLDEEQRLTKQQEETRARLDQLRVESATAGRLDIQSDGDLPVFPRKDSFIRNAALGGIGALMMSTVLVVGIGLMDRRVRGMDDVRAKSGTGGGQAPMLGVLPEIPEGLEDPELAARAAHNVHHVRTMLELWSDGRTPLSLTVTSPSSGSGKTSLTLALGVSFAAAGLRTLLVDMDLVGGGLSSRVDGMTRRRLGSMLVATGVLSDVQRIEALKLSSAKGIRLGEACVALGFATEEQINQTVRMQEDDSTLRGMGVMEALAGYNIEQCMRPTEVPGLFAMTLGGASVEQAGAISPALVKRMLNKVGEGYDVVLVDTGPTPGSLEAGACAAGTDGVVLTVARGEDRDAVRQCTEHLTRIGATVAGVVFNRATSKDVLRLSASRTSSWAGTSAARSAPRLSMTGETRTEGRRPDGSVEVNDTDSHPSNPVLGPVVNAVQSSVRGPRKGKES